VDARVCMVRGIHMHNMFLSGIDFWGGTWIRRIAPFREACVLTPLMPLSCMHGLTVTTDTLSPLTKCGVVDDSVRACISSMCSCNIEHTKVCT
jgi:hypothetical protein